MNLRMRTAFFLASVVGLILFALGVWAFADSYLRIARLTELQHATNAITSGGRRLALLSHDLIHHPEARQREQWHTLHDSLTRDLATHRDAFRPYRNEAAAVEHYLKTLQTQLTEYQTALDRPRTEIGGKALAMLTTQIGRRVAELESALDAQEKAVQHAIDVELGTSGEGLVAKFALLFGLYVLVGGAAWWFFYLRMQQPLSALESGIHRIRDGDYRFRPDKQAADEIGAVVDAFNELLDRRHAVEAELRNHQEHLENLVADRTRDLERAKELAEAANRAKSTFLANMSHELRTPMNAIMGLTDLALRHSEDPKLQDQLGKVMQASRHLLHIINDILDISKIEAERMTLEKTGFTLGEVLENLASLMGHKATEKGLRLLIDLEEGLPMRRFVGDPMRLGQILLNLAGNALKFTERGSISLRCRLIEENPEGVLLRWEVADTGIGIAPDDQQRLFTAFEQADGSMTRKYGGTGLGLAISKRLVRLMGGEIGVESAPGQGSTFWFTVRLGKSLASAVLPAPTFTGQSADERLLNLHAGKRILLAEDEPINQEVSRGLLEDAGLVVDLSEDGEQAVALARQNRYALILMDMQMPVMNGVEATLAIRADSPNRNTPILAMTANAFDEDRRGCLDAGMNDHITKPVDPDRLYETLLKWLERREG